jgi:undecaprenyl-diphosphatase
MLNTLLKLDENILLFIQKHVRNNALTGFMKFITRLGDAGFIWILITGILLSRKKTRKVGILSSCALIGSLIINNGILKNLVARIRPYEAVNGLVLMINKQTDWSFPSGHTGSSFACATVLFLNLPRPYGILALVLATFIGLSRLYVGIHYPSDVLFGAVNGIIIGYVVDKIGKKMLSKEDVAKFF